MSIPRKGLPSQPTVRELVDAASKAPSRPCLPAVESLGDRILLSCDDNLGVAAPLKRLTFNENGVMLANVTPQAVVNPPPQVSQILIGMMKGDTATYAQDLDMLKLAAEVDLKLAKKLGDKLLKIDQAIFKFGEALIKGEDVTLKQQKVMEVIDRQFLKIDTHIDRQTPEAQLKLMPAIDAIKLNVTQIVGEMGTVGPAPDLSSKDKQVLLKISNDWEQMDRVAIKLSEVIAIKKVAVDQDLLKIKLADVLVSSANVEDATLKAQLTDVAGEAEQILIGLLLPAVTGDVIS